MKKYLGPRVEFGGTVDKVVFSGAIRHMSVRSADPFLNKLLRKYADEARSVRATKSSTLRTSVENLIVPLLPHEKMNATKIARLLGLSRRTLYRRLMSEGLTFKGIVHDLRYDLAQRYLRETDLSISTIAWLLGYAETSAFTSAFKRWSGKSPRLARARHRWQRASIGV